MYLSFVLHRLPFDLDLDVLAEGLVEASHLVVVHTVQEVRVGVHSLYYGGMSEQGLNDFGAFSLLEELCSEGVAQRVKREALIVEASLFQQLLVVPVVQIVVIHWFTGPIREDEVMIVPL